MKHRLRKRYNQRHETTRPSRAFRHARRLSIERCEDRLMLSGTPPTTDASTEPAIQEGGFVSFNFDGLISLAASDFVTRVSDFPTRSLDEPPSSASPQDTVQFVDVDQTGGSTKNIVDVGLILSTTFDQESPKLRLDLTLDLNVGSSDQAADTSLSKTTGILNDTPAGPTLVDQSIAFGGQEFATFIGSVANDFALDDLEVPAAQVSDSPVLVASPVDKPVVVGVSGPPIHSIDLTAIDNLIEEPAKSDLELLSNGLPTKFSQLLVIDEPIQLDESRAEKHAVTDDESDTGVEYEYEGGSLEVFTAVETTQHAYETQLLKVIAANLNRDGDLPILSQPQTRPPIAELARAVAFETIEHAPISHTSGAVQPSELPFDEPPQASRLRPEPVEEFHRSKPNEVSKSVDTLSQRLENDQPTSHAAAFASWPLLATAIAGYLLVERRQSTEPSAVQTPPRRSR